MTRVLRRTSIAVATLAALLLGTLAGIPSAAATSSPIVASWRLEAGNYDLQPGLGAMWAVNTDLFHYGPLYRIDPATDSIRTVTTMPFPAGGMAVAFDSLWVTDYYGNAVWRFAPDGSVLAVFPTGLQPERIHAAFGSIWSSDHHGGSLTRIDPATSTVVGTVPVGQQHMFRNGPQDFTADSTRVYVGSSNLVKLQSVDPTTDAVATPSHRAGGDAFCGDLRAIAGSVWSSDPCSQAAYRLGTDGTAQQVFDASPGEVTSLTVLDRQVWIGRERHVDPDTGAGSQGVLDERNAHTGALLRTVVIEGDPQFVRGGYGDLWVFDARRHSVLRVAV